MLDLPSFAELEEDARLRAWLAVARKPDVVELVRGNGRLHPELIRADEGRDHRPGLDQLARLDGLVEHHRIEGRDDRRALEIELRDGDLALGAADESLRPLEVRLAKNERTVRIAFGEIIAEKLPFARCDDLATTFDVELVLGLGEGGLPLDERLLVVSGIDLQDLFARAEESSQSELRMLRDDESPHLRADRHLARRDHRAVGVDGDRLAPRADHSRLDDLRFGLLG